MHRYQGCRFFAAALLCIALALHGPPAKAQLVGGEDADATLARADATKTADHDAFVATLARLHKAGAQLTAAQQAHLRFLEAWQVAYQGDYEHAFPMLERVTQDSSSAVLRFRATATLVNILAVGHRYEEAFARLAQLNEDLPLITDPGVRLRGLAEAVQLLTAAGEHDLAADYAHRMLDGAPSDPASVCTATYIQLHALYRGQKIDSSDPRFSQGVERCDAAGEGLIANALRTDIADDLIQKNRPRDAIALLEDHYESALRSKYPSLTSEIQSLLAQAHQQVGDTEAAERYAHAAVNGSVPGEYSRPLAMALHVLYALARDRHDFAAAVNWLDQYMKADRGYLNDISARSIAYQVVNQQVVSSRMEAAALDRQNQILHLQREVDRRSMESSRLYIALLLIVIATIVFWLMRTRRLQKRFMQLARRDSLTGIHNRQHFVERASALLHVARKAGKPACMVMFDLDHFKTINDTYGHAEGDWTLLRVVAECRDHLLDHELFGRLGGEEFAIFLPGIDEVTGTRRAEIIRAGIASSSPAGPSSARVTASFGVAAAESHGYDFDGLLARADEALYQAKHSGRDRVAVAPGRAAATPDGLHADVLPPTQGRQDDLLARRKAL